MFLHALQTNPLTGHFEGWRSLRTKDKPTGTLGTMCFMVAMGGACAVSTSGCAALMPAIANFVQVANTVEADGQLIENGIVAAWPAVYALLPSASQPGAEAAFEKAKTSVDDALHGLAQAAQAGTDADQNNLAAAMVAVYSALSDFYSAVATWTDPTSMVAGRGAELTAVHPRVARLGGMLSDLKSNIARSTGKKL
jgi:hypothetical protein